MTDDADRTDGKIEASIAEGVRLARSGPTLAWSGACHYCESDVAEPLRFCDADCRDDFERVERARRIRGRG